MSEAFRIISRPAFRTVTSGAEVDYSLERIVAGPEAVSARWFAFNDPQSISMFRMRMVPGPVGLAWKGAKWSFEGHHRIACHVTVSGYTKAYAYEQWVVPVESALAGGPRLARNKEDPDAVLNAVTRLVGVLQAVDGKFPARTQDRENYEKFLLQQDTYREKLAERLESTAWLAKHPIHAEHFDAQGQQRQPLRAFLAQVAEDEWVIVDWTNPMIRAATGEYSGSGRTAEEAVRNALKDWDEDNRYPEGGISVRIPAIPSLSIPTIEKEFVTDGSAYWDSVSSWLGWIALGAAVVAGVVTLVAPVPGSQVISGCIWASIFSGTASAGINIGTRADEGFSSWQANAFDVLSIVGNVLGGTGIIWARGASTFIQVNGQAAKVALIGAVSADGVQGVMIGYQFIEEFDEIRKDPSIPPQERTDRLVKIFGSALAHGLLFYMNVKGTKSDLDGLNLKGTREGATSPAERLRKLADPDAEIVLAEVPKIEVQPGNGQPHVTKVQIDPEIQPPQVAAHPAQPVNRPKPKPRPREKQGTSDLDMLYREAAVAKKELDALTKELAEELGGETVLAKLKERARAEEKIASYLRGDASLIDDLARSSISFDSLAEVTKAFQVMQSRFKLIVQKDRFHKPLKSGYRDILMTMRMSNGHMVEIQLQLSSILRVSNGEGHQIYETIRSIEAKAKVDGRPLTRQETEEIIRLTEMSKKLYDAAFESGKGG